MISKKIACSLFKLSFQLYDSGLLTTDHEVPGSIPGSTMGIFLCRGRIPVVTMVWVVSRSRLKAPPGTLSPYISPLTPSGQRNCASWASQPQKLVTLPPQPGGGNHKSLYEHVVALEKKNFDGFHHAVLDWHFLLAAGRMFNFKSVGYSKEKCPIVCCFTLLRLSGTQPTTFKWGLNVQGDQKVSMHLTITVQYTIGELKVAITEYIRNVYRAILNTVFENTVRRVNKCLETGRGHFEHY